MGGINQGACPKKTIEMESLCEPSRPPHLRIGAANKAAAVDDLGDGWRPVLDDLGRMNRGPQSTGLLDRAACPSLLHKQPLPRWPLPPVAWPGNQHHNWRGPSGRIRAELAPSAPNPSATIGWADLPPSEFEIEISTWRARVELMDLIADAFPSSPFLADIARNWKMREGHSRPHGHECWRAHCPGPPWDGRIPAHFFFSPFLPFPLFPSLSPSFPAKAFIMPRPVIRRAARVRPTGRWTMESPNKENHARVPWGRIKRACGSSSIVPWAS